MRQLLFWEPHIKRQRAYFTWKSTSERASEKSRLAHSHGRLRLWIIVPRSEHTCVILYCPCQALSFQTCLHCWLVFSAIWGIEINGLSRAYEPKHFSDTETYLKRPTSIGCLELTIHPCRNGVGIPLHCRRRILQGSKMILKKCFTQIVWESWKLCCNLYIMRSV